MGNKKSPKIEALVVNAIRRLQDVQGSTPREISNYISQEYDVQGRDIKKQVELALRRGVSYGILQRTKGGYYSCNRDFLSKPMDNAEMVQERCKSRRRRRRRRSRAACGVKSLRRRRKRRRGRSACKSRSRRGRSRRRRSRRRRSRRRRSRGRKGVGCKRASRAGRRRRRRRRRSRAGRRCDARPVAELNILPEAPESERNESPLRASRDPSPGSGDSSLSGSSDGRGLDENLSDPPMEAIPSSFNSYIN